MDGTLMITLYHNTILEWLIALAAAVGVGVALFLIRRIATGRLRVRAQRTGAETDDLLLNLLQRSRSWFILIVALWSGTQFLALPERVDRGAHSALVLALLLQAALWGSGLVTFWLEHYKQRALRQDPTAATTVTAFGFIIRMVLWTAIVLMALQNLGFHIDTLLAGLGVGGIAVALAVQNILGDLFASLSIVLDKPFLIGDFITVDTFLGTVEHIGLKTTRVRSLTGEQLIFANSDLLKSRIRNYKRMQERRAVFTLNIAYGTLPEQLAALPGIIRAVVEAQEKVRFERAHFKEVAAYSFTFEVVYWLVDADYNLYMDTQQAINLELLRRLNAAGIALAFPTQAVVLQQQG